MMMKPKDDKRLPDTVTGLTKVDPKRVEEFTKVMRDEVIPEVVKTIEKRRLQAASRKDRAIK